MAHPELYVHHTTLEIAPEEVKDCHIFYCDVLELTVIPSPFQKTMWFAEGIHLYWGADKPPHEGKISARHIALAVGDHYENIVRECMRSFLFLDHATSYWRSPRCYVQDPAGNRIELMVYPPPPPLPNALAGKDG